MSTGMSASVSSLGGLLLLPLKERAPVLSPEEIVFPTNPGLTSWGDLLDECVKHYRRTHPDRVLHPIGAVKDLLVQHNMTMALSSLAMELSEEPESILSSSSNLHMLNLRFPSRTHQPISCEEGHESRVWVSFVLVLVN